jgi:phosphotransferase system, enzyme I, PtsP
MDLHARLVAVVDEAESASHALIAATRIIAEAVAADACTIFVRRKNGGFDVGAHFGAQADPATSDAAQALAAKALDDVRPYRSEACNAAVVAVPVAALNHGIGAIVARRALAFPFTTEEVMRLSGLASQMVEPIETARWIKAIEHPGAEAWRAEDASESPPSTGERMLRGIAASPGIAIGAAVFRNTFPRALVRREKTRPESLPTGARLRDALQKTRNDLVRLQSEAASEVGEEHGLIFGAHLLLLNDHVLTDLVAQNIAAGHPAPVAIDDAFDEIVRRLRDVHDPYIEERVEDVEDVRSRILGHLIGVERQGDLDTRIVVSARTTPSLIVELKARGAVGVASELGGSTSHGALIARALGVPAVTGVKQLTDEISAGDPVIVDGDEGLVIIRPTAETRAEYERRGQAVERRRTEFLRYRDEPARTADGMRFQLQANIALGSDLEIARDNRADGIGLYRTEFPFIVRDALPSIEEQTRIYTKAYEAFPAAPVTLRLLDLAGDKFLPSGALGVARDAFHGYRSIRVLFDHPHVLRDQVQAFAMAAAGRQLRILIPLVTSLEDVVRIKGLVEASLAQSPGARALESLSYGAMIETPAAVEMIEELASEVDFFSIGTNDLAQYSLVADREDPRMTSWSDAYHPAILRMIRRLTLRAHGKGRPVTVCGEMAARADLAIALLAFGVDALSVTPRIIPELKQALAQVAVEPLRARVDDLLAISTAGAVKSALQAYIRNGQLIPPRPA